jgi:5-methylthioadenosine/S-adenosylhomocysteine deaminase
MSTILIKNGYLVTMDSKGNRYYCDLLIEDKRIKQIAPKLDIWAEKVIDARGMLVLPGFIQVHVHLCQSLLRGQADDVSLMQWLERPLL